TTSPRLLGHFYFFLLECNKRVATDISKKSVKKQKIDEKIALTKKKRKESSSSEKSSSDDVSSLTNMNKLLSAFHY
ncbi:hypothetical protein FRX31_024233, partial [Thalictrum thalictroides]